MCDTIEFRFRRRYRLTSSDPRFLAATEEEMLVDLLAHQFVDDPKTREDMVTDDFDEELAALEAEAEAGVEEAPVDLPDDFYPVGF